MRTSYQHIYSYLCFFAFLFKTRSRYSKKLERDTEITGKALIAFTHIFVQKENSTS